MKNKEPVLFDKLHFPKDITQGAFILTAIGNSEIYIENYKGILEYSKNRIRIQGKNTYILIEGKNLTIDHYTEEDMLIKGHIFSIQYPS
ncbi:MAG: YabP/YqfC family sporulation protein [Lachnospiraceae bacterium]|nr:YabP/YqfC family sporulation protein [Lachnospiraceae bacterium]